MPDERGVEWSATSPPAIAEPRTFAIFCDACEAKASEPMPTLREASQAARLAGYTNVVLGKLAFTVCAPCGREVRDLVVSA